MPCLPLLPTNPHVHQSLITTPQVSVQQQSMHCLYHRRDQLRGAMYMRVRLAVMHLLSTWAVVVCRVHTIPGVQVGWGAWHVNGRAPAWLMGREPVVFLLPLCLGVEGE